MSLGSGKESSGDRRVVKVGMGQMLVRGGQPEANLARAVDMTSRAGELGCQVIVLPECLDLGWMHPSAADKAESVPGPRSDILAAAAARSGLCLVAGLTECDKGRIYNSAVLINSDGSLLLKHRKINELGIAHGLYSCGRKLSVSDTPAGCIGVSICADNFPDSLCIAETLVRMGAEMILSPSAWAVAADHDNTADPYGSLWERSYGEIARRFKVPVAGVSNVGWLDGGPWAGKKCIGASMAVDSEGKVAARASYGEDAEELVTVELEIGRGYGWGTEISEALAERTK